MRLYILLIRRGCDYYLKHDLKYPSSLKAEVKNNLAQLEKVTKKKLCDARTLCSSASFREASARSVPRHSAERSSILWAQ